MHPDLKLLVRLQVLDNRVLALKREIESLPVHIAEIEKKLNSHQRKLEADRAALAANQKDRKKFEGEIPVQEQKISKLKGQMLDVKTNEQYKAFQHEIEYCQNEIRRAEDRILDLMAESEPLEKNVKAAEQALGIEKAQVESEKQQARERTAEDKKKLEELAAERAELVAKVNATSYRRYENIKQMRKGIGVAEAVDGRCSACHMAMRLQFFQDLKKADQVMSCESCGRLLYYHPPVAIEDLTGEPAPAVKE